MALKRRLEFRQYEKVEAFGPKPKHAQVGCEANFWTTFGLLGRHHRTKSAGHFLKVFRLLLDVRFDIFCDLLGRHIF